MDNVRKHPKYVRVKGEDGVVSQVPYKDIIEYEESIIEDNCCYGLKLVCKNELTEVDVSSYKKEAITRLRKLKKQIADNPTVTLRIEEGTQRYIVDQ